MKKSISQVLCALGVLFSVSACTNPYDPAQRAIGGGLIGAGAGAAIGAAAGGGHGAALGAAVGGVTGALAGIATTPPPPPPPGYYGSGYRRYGGSHRRHATKSYRQRQAVCSPCKRRAPPPASY